MSANSSSTFSPDALIHECFHSRRNISISTAFFICYTLLILPLFVLILHVGFQRWRKQHSEATQAMMSHSDIFTFNMIALEMIGLLGSCLYCYGAYTDELIAVALGMYIYSIISSTQSLFHLLTCVERYLAVVHPVTYMGLKQSGGVRIRNISIVCVWLFCFGSAFLTLINVYFNIMYNFVLLGISSVVVSFCSLSVLRVLIRPGPGEVGGNRERVDQTKQRAFYTITAILGSLMLRFLSILFSTGIYHSSLLSYSERCLVWSSALWFSLPSSLVLPLLFLQRAGKLPGCKHNT